MKTSKLYPPGRILVAVDGSPASRKALAFAGMLRRRCRVQEVILGGEAAGTILKASRNARPDLIVMGGKRSPPYSARSSAIPPNASYSSPTGRCQSSLRRS